MSVVLIVVLVVLGVLLLLAILGGAAASRRNRAQDASLRTDLAAVDRQLAAAVDWRQQAEIGHKLEVVAMGGHGEVELLDRAVGGDADDRPLLRRADE